MQTFFVPHPDYCNSLCTGLPSPGCSSPIHPSHNLLLGDRSDRPQPCSKPFKDHPLPLDIRLTSLPDFQGPPDPDICLSSLPPFLFSITCGHLSSLAFRTSRVLVLACNAIPHHPHPCSRLALHVTGQNQTYPPAMA